jgi:co-chaperonin GroES (HSP10)
MIKPCGHRVVVRPDEISDKRGALYVPASTREREQYAQIFGEIVAIGPQAWQAFGDGVPWAKVGDRVAIAKYGGFVIEDPETKEQFRLLNDEDITCVITGDYKLAKEA